MEICYCKEPCFFFEKKTVINRERQDYKQTIIFNRCNRSLAENPKKKPCNYKTSKIISETIINDGKSNENQDYKLSESKKPIQTYNDIKIKIDKLLEFYNINSTNYFGRLNNYLKILGYSMHDPPTETLNELKCRLEKPPKKNKPKIYINKDSFLSQNMEEREYDEEKLEEYYNGIFKNIEISKQWKNDETLKSILTINKNTKKSKKNKLHKKLKNTNRTNYLNVLDDIENKEKDIDIDNTNNEYDSSEDEEEKEERDKDEDNEFDVDNLSEDDYDNCEEDDFSD